MDPATPIETLCRIILRGREYEAQVPTDYDGGEAPENVDDEGEETLSVLDDAINNSVEEELNAVLEDLAEDQLAEVLAFCWVGQGTYDASDWDEALEEAASENHVIDAQTAPARAPTRPPTQETLPGRPGGGAGWSRYLPRKA